MPVADGTLSFKLAAGRTYTLTLLKDPTRVSVNLTRRIPVRPPADHTAFVPPFSKFDDMFGGQSATHPPTQSSLAQ